MKGATAVFLVAILALPLEGLAQQRPAAGGTEGAPEGRTEGRTEGAREGATLVAPQQQPPPAQNPSETVDPSKLGVSLDRIRRELRQAEVKEQSGGPHLKIEFTVEVFGIAPKINLIENFPLTGPVPYGAPTHREVIDFLTPQEYRSPVIPFSTIAYWAAQQLWNRSKKQRCEEELAEYKRLVMQGVSVAAPRCTQ